MNLNDLLKTTTHIGGLADTTAAPLNLCHSPSPAQPQKCNSKNGKSLHVACFKQVSETIPGGEAAKPSWILM